MEGPRTLLAQGVSAVIPTDWKYFAETDQDNACFAITFSNENSNAQLELLNPHQLSVEKFISSNLLMLKNELSKLGYAVEGLDTTSSSEVVAIDKRNDSFVVHFFLPNSPIAHISAKTIARSDIDVMRKLAKSVQIDSQEWLDDGNELFPMRLSGAWEKVNQSEA